MEFLSLTVRRKKKEIHQAVFFTSTFCLFVCLEMYTDLNNIQHVSVSLFCPRALDGCHAVRHVEALFPESSSFDSAASVESPDTVGVVDKRQTHTVVPA